jgi:hypothetical protein
MEREEIGLNDADGRAIRLGDIVEFWHCACSWHSGGGHTSPTKECPNQIKAVDYVYKAKTKAGKITYSFCQSEIQSGAYAWRYNKGCRVVGRLPEDAALIVDAFAFVPTGAEREKIIAQVKGFALGDRSVMEASQDAKNR